MTPTRTVNMHWHGMICPSCFTNHRLTVSFRGTANLTEDGSEACGDHEWGLEDRCTCTSCDFSGDVIQFANWEKFDPVSRTTDVFEEGDAFPVYDTDTESELPCDFEIQVFGMAQTAPDQWELADEVGIPPAHFDIQFTRSRSSTGSVEVLIEHENLTDAAAQKICKSLEARFPEVDCGWV